MVPPRTAERLRAEKARILALWEARVRDGIPPANQVDPLALRNALPDLLDRVSASLAHPAPASASDVAFESSAAAEHGRQRARMQQYSLDQVISEYQVLRRVMLEVLEEKAPLPAMERDLISEIILEAIRNAADEFARLRQREREAAQTSLRTANEELERRVDARVAQLRLSEMEFRDMLEAVVDYALFTVSTEGYITSWNAGCVRMKGYTAEEAIGKHFSMLYPEDGRRRDEPMSHLRVAAVEGRFRGEGLRIRKNGKLFLADVSITPTYKDRSLAGFTKVVQDLTERSQLIQERDLSRSHAARMTSEVAYRERFVAAVSHDLRSPLTTVKLAADRIALTPEVPDDVRGLARRISDNVSRADRMILDLLDASRLHAGQPLPLAMEPCDLRQVAEAVCEELARRHGPRFVVGSAGPTDGFWSPDGLRRILENLLTNAVKYGEEAKPITVRIRRLEDRVLLTVHNHGTFIPPQEQSEMFAPFRRSKGAEASGKAGWGIGLTLVRGLAEAHGGIAKVESYPSEGTTFTVDLPADARGQAGSDPAAGRKRPR